jgi:hypothetical protein
VGSGDPVQQVKYRECHRDEHALECAESQDGDCRSERQRELRPPETADSSELRHIHETHRGVHDGGSERRGGERREDGPEEHDGQDHHGERRNRVQLAAAPHRIGDRRPAPAAAHRETLCRSDREVGRADGQELLVAVQAAGVPCLERASSENVVGERHHGDSQGCGNELTQIARLDVRELHGRELPWDGLPQP